MKPLLLILILSVAAAAWAAHVPAPVSLTGQRAARYQAATRRALAEMQVTVRELTLRGSALCVSYEDANETDSHAYVLAAVLTLAAPLAAGSEEIRASAFSQGRKLDTVAVAPDDLRSVYGAELSAGDEDRLAQLAAAVRHSAGLTSPPVSDVSPVANTSLQTPSPAPVPAAPVALTEAQQQQLADRLLAATKDAKLENLTIAVNAAREWRLAFENRTYRSDLDALGVCLQRVAEILPAVPLTVVVKRDDLPVCSVRLPLGDYAAAQGELLTPEELARRWQVTTPESESGDGWQTLAQGASSLGKVDLAVRPAIHYEIGNEARSFSSDEYLVANADATLARGWHANLQSSTRLTAGVSSVLDRALLTKTDRVGPRWLATGSVGKFEESLYGWYGELQWDGGGHRLGLTGNSVGDTMHCLSQGRRQLLGYYEYEDGGLGLTLRLGYGRSLDSGGNEALLALQRRFGESTVTAEAIRGDGGAEALNLRLSTPLGPRSAQSPAALRLRSDPAFTVAYGSNPSLAGDYLQKGQDLAAFRGELSPRYVGRNPRRVLGGLPPAASLAWEASPSLEGNSGLIRIPTADVIADGTVLAGVSYLGEDQARVATATPTSVTPLFLGLGLLPNWEVVGKISILHDVKAFSWSHNLDRSLNTHYRLLKQGRHTPALAVGAQDVMFGTTTSYVDGEAQYLVGTFAREQYRLHLGVGHGRLAGLFGGVDYAFSDDHRLRLMMDYDTASLNVGLRGFLSKRVTLDLSLLGLSDLAGSLVFRTELR